MPDYSFIANQQPQNPLNSLGSMLNIANAAQDYQQQQQLNPLQLQQLAAQTQTAQAGANVATNSVQADIGKRQADFELATTNAKRASLGLTQDLRTNVGQLLGYLGYLGVDDPAMVDKALDQHAKQSQNPEIQQFVEGTKPVLSFLPAGKGVVKNALLQYSQSLLTPAEQQSRFGPSTSYIDDNQWKNPMIVTPAVGNNPPTVQFAPNSAAVQNQVPPTTTIIGPNNQPGYLGPQPRQVQQPSPAQQPSPVPPWNAGPIAQATQQRLENRAKAGDQEAIDALSSYKAWTGQQPTQQKPSFIPSGMPVGANDSRAGSIAVVNDHWNKINSGSADAPLMQSLVSNIKSLASSAITGTESGRKSYVLGLLNALGVGDKATGDMQKDTDLLQKQLAQLNLATPATTDAMRTIVNAARPHSTMVDSALPEAADQIGGQIQANMAVRNFLQPYKADVNQNGDPVKYEAAREQIEKIADPRAWQYKSMGRAEQKAFINKLSPADRASLIDNTKRLEDLGMLK